jgi:hypothetical protein
MAAGRADRSLKTLNRACDPVAITCLTYTPVNGVQPIAGQRCGPRRIAANVAKLPELLRKVAAFPNYLFSIDLDQSEISEPGMPALHQGAPIKP